MAGCWAGAWQRSVCWGGERFFPGHPARVGGRSFPRPPEGQPEALAGRTAPALQQFPLVSVGNWGPRSPCRAAISRDPFYEMLAARKKKVSSTKRH